MDHNLVTKFVLMYHFYSSRYK